MPSRRLASRLVLLTALSAGAVFGATPASASAAATVAVEGERAVYRSAFGAANVVKLGGEPAAGLVFGGDPVQPGPGCGVFDPDYAPLTGVYCSVRAADVDVLDGDDSVLVGQTGACDAPIPEICDAVTGSVRVRGGAGQDLVDIAYGQPGRFAVAISGGEGADTVTSSSAAVSLSLDDVANDGPISPAGTVVRGDDVRGDVEHLAGSPHADRLVGNGRANRLEGADGHDRLVGGGGADLLRGGLGDDTVDSRDGAPDVVDCGPGAGDRAVADRFDVLLGCERRSR